MTHISQIPILNRMLWPSRALGLGEVVLFFLVSFFTSLAILVPLSGALVRWRVHYNPRRIQLEDAEDQDDGILSAAESHRNRIFQHVAENLRGRSAFSRNYTYLLV
ncbi:hypothetical protein PM082_018033 [Marasmius tenuissimus]|nr:hypothetical protein PM082_018033 [Marasmius tenuissimus]